MKRCFTVLTFWGEELVLRKIDKPEDLLEAWNSEKMKLLRKNILKENIEI